MKKLTNTTQNIITTSEYNKIHKWLRKEYGNADHCENTECDNASKKFEWAMIHEKGYDYKRENFKQLCQNCHAKYDSTQTDTWQNSQHHIKKIKGSKMWLKSWEKKLSEKHKIIQGKF